MEDPDKSVPTQSAEGEFGENPTTSNSQLQVSLMEADDHKNGFGPDQSIPSQGHESGFTEEPQKPYKYFKFHGTQSRSKSKKSYGKASRSKTRKNSVGGRSNAPTTIMGTILGNEIKKNLKIAENPFTSVGDFYQQKVIVDPDQAEQIALDRHADQVRLEDEKLAAKVANARSMFTRTIKNITAKKGDQVKPTIGDLFKKKLPAPPKKSLASLIKNKMVPGGPGIPLGRKKTIAGLISKKFALPKRHSILHPPGNDGKHVVSPMPGLLGTVGSRRQSKILGDLRSVMAPKSQQIGSKRTSVSRRASVSRRDILSVKSPGKVTEGVSNII
jgi:hypothetical protein